MKTPIYTGIFQSDLDATGFKLVNLSAPSAGGDAANKAYVDAHPGGGGGGGGLDANTVTADGIGLVGDGSTDNTTSLQTWLNSVAATKVNSTLLVPDGLYIFSGPLQDTSRGNAQIILPSNAFADRPYTVTIKGYHPLSYIPWPSASMNTPQGPIFRSTLGTGGGTGPTFIGGMGPASGSSTANLSFMGVRFEDMILQTVQNPLISCLDLSHYSVVELAGDVLIMAGTKVGSTDTVQPTTTTSYGLKMPLDSSGMVQRVDNVIVSNFYTGALIGELCHLVNIVCAMCYYALEFGFAYHIALIERMEDWWCRNGINMTGANTFQVQQYDVERGADGNWFTRVNDINDPSNQATAEITWWTIKTGTGAQNIFTINGGANVQARQAGTLQASPFYIGTDLRLVAISGGGKLQARNTGTNTWADVDQWTNP